LVYLSAGSLGVSPARFVFYDTLGALISVPIVVSLGYVFGNQIDRAVSYVGGFERAVLLIVLLSAGFYLARLLLTSRQSDAPGTETPL
jgi:membrane protein DedA with SNARE-associated domain